MGYILDDIADLFEELTKKKSAEKVGRDFGRSRKWVACVKCGCSFTLNSEFIAGLRVNGYDLVLVKRGKKADE